MVSRSRFTLHLCFKGHDATPTPEEPGIVVSRLRRPLNKPKPAGVPRVRRETVCMRGGRLRGEVIMSTEEWVRISRTLDFVLAQQPTKTIKESPASYGIRGEPERPKRKPKKQKKEQPAEQLRLF
jgi:hypothetical protein